MSNPTLITGRKGGTYPRYAIEDLQANYPEQFLLFTLAYLLIQERNVVADQSAGDQGRFAYSAYNSVQISGFGEDINAMKYSELAGIHGLPYQAWKGDPNHKAAPAFNDQDLKDMGPHPKRFGGYCNHGSVLFPSWHRPYVMAVEQSIGAVADEIAKFLDDAKIGDQKAFPDTDWKDAAKQLRLPYWDWSDKKVLTDGLPKVLYEEQLDLQVGNDTVTFPNPLAYFIFKEIPAGFEDKKDPDTGATAYFSKWTQTVRHGASNPNIITSDIDELNKQLKDELPALRARLASLFCLPTGEGEENETMIATRTYDEFSNHTVQSTNKLHYYTSDSLEGIHDTMHDIIGGNGHMGNPDYAGFDPIFFLHHCNVDRLYALWEYVYTKNCYIGNATDYVFTQNRGTYALVYNSLVLGETDLAPFRVENGNYWTSDHSRYFDSRGYKKYYTYPEFLGIKVDQSATDDERAGYREALQEYYDIGSTYTVSVKLDQMFRSVVPLKGIAAQPKLGGSFSRVPNAVRIVIGIQTPEFAFNGPYAIKIFYEPSETESEYVGSFSVFTRQDDSACDNCRKRRAVGNHVHGIIPIPKAIVEKVVETFTDGEFETQDIVDRIKESLKAKIVNSGGQTLAKANGGYSGLAGNAKVLDREFTPTITLASANVLARKPKHGDTAKPVQWFNWNNHGEIFEPQLDVPGWAINSVH